MKTIISVKADIHIDGDVYIEHKNKMYYIGFLSDKEISVTDLPNKSFLRVKKLKLI